MSENIYIDKPLSFSDSLNYRIYAKSIAKFILESETPLTVGLSAPWGYGKSTIMNLIRLFLDKEYFQESSSNIDTNFNKEIQKFYESNLANNKDFTTIFFNSWIFFNSKDIGENLFDQIIVELVNKNIANKTIIETGGEQIKSGILKAWKLIKAFKFKGEIGIPGVGKIGGEYQIPDLFENEISISNVKKEFESFVSQMLGEDTNKNLLIIIDDIDRLNPEHAIEVIIFMKNFLDTKRCVFLVASDNEVIEAGLSRIYGNNELILRGVKKDFFEKIYQISFRIPDLVDTDIEKYISGFKEISPIISDSKIKNELVEFIKISSGFNPRSIKKLINLYKLWSNIFNEKIDLSKNKLNKNDLELIKFEIIVLHSYYYDVFIALKIFGNNLYDKLLIKKEIEKELSNYIKDDNKKKKDQHIDDNISSIRKQYLEDIISNEKFYEYKLNEYLKPFTRSNNKIITFLKDTYLYKNITGDNINNIICFFNILSDVKNSNFDISNIIDESINNLSTSGSFNSGLKNLSDFLDLLKLYKKHLKLCHISDFIKSLYILENESRYNQVLDASGIDHILAEVLNIFNDILAENKYPDLGEYDVYKLNSILEKHKDLNKSLKLINDITINSIPF